MKMIVPLIINLISFPKESLGGRGSDILSLDSRETEFISGNAATIWLI